MAIRSWPGMLLAVLLPAWLAACGGSDGGPEADALTLDEQAQVQRLGSLAADVPVERRRAQGTPVFGLDAAAAANQVFDIAESVLPAYFPGHQATRTVNGWYYRYYRTSGVYIAVINWDVYVLGGVFGPEVATVGPVSSFVTSASNLSTLYGTLTLRYRFSGGNNVYTDSVSFSSASLTADGKTLAGMVSNSTTRAIACQVSTRVGYDYFCVILDNAPGFESTEILFFNLSSSRKVTGGIYEYCFASLSTDQCTADLFSSADGEVLTTSAITSQPTPGDKVDAMAAAEAKRTTKGAMPAQPSTRRPLAEDPVQALQSSLRQARR